MRTHSKIIACFSILTCFPAFAQTSQPDPVVDGLSQSLGISRDEAKRRLDLLSEANQIAKRMEADIGIRYGGLKVENAADFKVEFFVTGNPDKVLAAYTTRPEFVATRVTRSYQSLVAKFNQLERALKAGNRKFLIAVNPADNIVEITHLPDDESRKILQATRALDDSVRIIESDEPFVQTATCYGGSQLSSSTEYGTSGFVVTDNLQTRRGIITAAHVGECRAGKDCSGNTVTPTGCTVNSSVRDDASGVSFTWVRQVIDADNDVEFRVPVGTHTLSNQIKYGSSGTVMSVTAKYNPRDYAAGTFNFCKQGRKSGYTCGYFDSNSVAFSGNGITQYFVRGRASATNTAIVAAGDSGGPVFTNGGAVGTTIGAGGTKLGTCPNNTYTYIYVQPISDLTALNVSVLLTP